MKIDIGEDGVNMLGPCLLDPAGLGVFPEISCPSVHWRHSEECPLGSCPVLDFLRVTIDYSPPDTWAKKMGCQVLRSGPGPGGPLWDGCPGGGSSPRLSGSS